MKSWFTKTVLGQVIFFSTGAVALPSAADSLNWHYEHYHELKDSIQACLQVTSLCPVLKEGPTNLYLASKPNEIRAASKFNVTIISGLIEQGEVKLNALFFVQQQLDSHNAMAVLLYTSDDELHMPSMRLLLDVRKHPFMQQLPIPERHNLHITTTNVEQTGTYTQEWIFYNEHENQKVNIIFTPDGAGGTDFQFINKT